MTDQTPLRGTDAAREAIRQARGDEAAPQIPILFAHHDENGAGNDPAAIGTVPPEIVNAIIRDPDSPLHPSQIGVYCDDCGTTVKADYLVSTNMTKAERLEVARKHLRAQGWRCDEFGDVCPSCERPPAAAVLAEVAAERLRQDATWGEQNHRDGTGPDRVWAFTGPASYVADCARQQTQQLAADGHVTWTDIALEEFAEALAESDPERLRAELVQVAAVAVAWVEAIDRRTTAAPDADLP
jgi:hypothetical protein